VGDVSRRAWPIRRRPAPASSDELPADPFPADPSDPPPPPRQRVTLPALRLAALGLALVLTITITMVRLFVGGPPSVEELRARAGVDNWPTLTIGVKDDQPGTGIRNKDGTWSGFDIDIAYMIAEDLGFRRSEVRFFAVESEDRARMQATEPNGKRVPVRMVIASYSITAKRAARPDVTFSQPYLFTEQSVLTLAGHAKVSTLQDLKGKDVCSLSTSTSEAGPNGAKAIVHSRNRMGECIEDLRAGRVEAVTTDAAILAGYKYQSPTEFAHWDLGLDDTEAWGVNTGENKDLAKLVDLTLYRSLKDPHDERWEIAYDTNLQVEVPANGRTPIAQAQQPNVTKPDVREQPWEDVLP
jgi:glutamate transport system substrate-binding protein